MYSFSCLYFIARCEETQSYEDSTNVVLSKEDKKSRKHQHKSKKQHQESQLESNRLESKESHQDFQMQQQQSNVQESGQIFSEQRSQLNRTDQHHSQTSQSASTIVHASSQGFSEYTTTSSSSSSQFFQSSYGTSSSNAASNQMVNSSFSGGFKSLNFNIAFFYSSEPIKDNPLNF